IDFVVENCDKFMVLQEKYQGNFVLSIDIYNDLNKLYLWHESNLYDFENDPIRSKILSDSKQKLHLYLKENKMPFIETFKSIRFLDPRKFKFLPQSIENYQNKLLELSNCSKEWLLYCDIVGETNLNVEFDMFEFWKTNKKRLPLPYGQAELYLYFPCNTAAFHYRHSTIDQLILYESENSILLDESLIDN
ncbi:unnamed protein product, partial [Brachionus calyciflorus]